jgi:hypothetical protein
MIPDLDNLKALMGVNQNDPSAVLKALTVSSGFVGYNLEPVAKLMLPLYAGFRNSLAVDRPKIGAQAATYRIQSGFGNTFGQFGTAFAAVGQVISGSAVSISATYATQSVYNSVDFEAMQMAMGWDDALKIASAQSLASLIRYDELLCLGGNTATIGTPVPAFGASGSAGSGSGTLTLSGTIVVTALTLEGCIGNATTFANSYGETVGGSISVGASLKSFIDLSWPAIPGALGYKVYMGTAASSAYCLVPGSSGQVSYSDGTAITAIQTGQQYVTVNKVRITGTSGSTNVPPSSDTSANSNAFEGVTSWCEKTTIYSQAVGSHSNVDMAGATFTTIPSGISQIDSVLQPLWSNWKIGPTRIMGGAKTVSKLNDAILNLSNPLNVLNITDKQGGYTGGIFVGAYTNKFAASQPGAGQAASVIPIWAHPDLPEGTLLFLSENIPYQYSQEGRGLALDVLTPYTYMDQSRDKRYFPFSIHFTETLKCYHPQAFAAIQGIRCE